MSSSIEESVLFPVAFSVEMCQYPFDLLSNYNQQDDMNYNNCYGNSVDIMLSSDDEQYIDDINEDEIVLYPFHLLHNNDDNENKSIDCLSPLSISISIKNDVDSKENNEISLFDTISNSLDISENIEENEMTELFIMSEHDLLFKSFNHDTSEICYFDQIEDLLASDNCIFNVNDCSIETNELYVMASQDMNVNQDFEASYFDQFESVYNINHQM